MKQGKSHVKHIPDQVEKLKKALLLFQGQEHVVLADHLGHQKVDALVNSLYLELDKLQHALQPGQQRSDEQVSQEEKLAAMMAKISNGLRGGTVSVCRDVADDFLKALELFELAREVKEAGKLAALKDRYQAV